PRCHICQNNTWMGKPIGLILDHIDGDHANNSIENLRLVCGNCDMQLPTYKSKNRGKGRAFRRDRYAKGMSY
ncbi:MAG: HNH endonuclease, partial [Rhabdochlamydiaceae bacterium]